MQGSEEEWCRWGHWPRWKGPQSCAAPLRELGGLEGAKTWEIPLVFLLPKLTERKHCSQNFPSCLQQRTLKG